MIREFAAEALVVVSADAVYKLDYREVVDQHLDSGATVTMVTTRVPKQDAGRYGVVGVADDGTVTEFAYKPDEPATDLVTNEVFVFTPDRTLDLLDQIEDELDEQDEGLADLGDQLLPRLVEAGEAREHRFEGYWRDVGTVQAYWDSHMDLLGPDPPIDLDEPGWRIQTQGGRSAAAGIDQGAEVDNCLLSGVPHRRIGARLGDLAGCPGRARSQREPLGAVARRGRASRRPSRARHHRSSCRDRGHVQNRRGRRHRVGW